MSSQTLYPYADFTAARLKSAIARQDAADSAIITQFIEAGRGHERHSDIVKQSDALSIAYVALSEQGERLREEKRRRERFHGRMTPLPEGHRQTFYAA